MRVSGRKHRRDFDPGNLRHDEQGLLEVVLLDQSPRLERTKVSLQRFADALLSRRGDLAVSTLDDLDGDHAILDLLLGQEGLAERMTFGPEDDRDPVGEGAQSGEVEFLAGGVDEGEPQHLRIDRAVTDETEGFDQDTRAARGDLAGGRLIDLQRDARARRRSHGQAASLLVTKDPTGVRGGRLGLQIGATSGDQRREGEMAHSGGGMAERKAGFHRVKDVRLLRDRFDAREGRRPDDDIGSTIGTLDRREPLAAHGIGRPDDPRTAGDFFFESIAKANPPKRIGE